MTNAGWTSSSTAQPHVAKPWRATLSWCPPSGAPETPSTKPATWMAELWRRRYPELVAGGPQRLLVLGAELGGRWHPDSIALVRMLTALRRLRAPPSLRATAAAGCPPLVVLA